MKTLFTIVATVATVSSFAQDVKFGKLSKQDFEKTKSTIQADAPAEVLYADEIIKLVLIPIKAVLSKQRKFFIG